jgi:hypothetical protein
MVNHKHLIKLLAKRIDDYIYKHVVNNDSEDLPQVAEIIRPGRLEKAEQLADAVLYKRPLRNF